jgi:hypothetical protein
MSELKLTDAQWASFAAEFCKGFTKEQAEVCRTFCEVRGLLPGKHVIFNLRSSSDWDEAVGAKVKTTKIIFMTTIDASRLIAERTKLYNGQAPEQYIYLDENGAPSIVSEIPLPQLPLKPGQQALPREPWAVRTTVHRRDFTQPITSVARFDAYAATYFDKNKNEVRLNEMWSRRGPEQLAKCSEMLSLRKAFPEELGGLYLAEEFKPDQEEVAKQPISPTVAIPSLPEVPKVDQTPAVGTDAPRPGEIGQKIGQAGPNLTAEQAAQIREALPQVEKILSNPVVLEKLAAEGKKIDQAAIDQLKKDVGLKPASELPAPRKRGRKPKESPENGQPAPGAGEITNEDLDQIGTPAPVVDRTAGEKAATEFVDSVTNFTSEEAAAAGLPEPPDYSRIPEKGSEEMKTIVARVRALTAAGALSADVKNYILEVGKKSETDKLTVKDWKTALDQLEAALAESKDKLKEVTKNAPLPEKF